jgi:ribosome maturation factor RimP
VNKHKKIKKGRQYKPAAALAVPAKATTLARRVREVSEPLCETEGFELVHVEFQPEAGGRILRLYIDKPGGVTLDDCVNISRQVSDLLDISFESLGSYNLEVSSPGPERPLGKESDYNRFKGRKVKIKTSQPINGQKNFKGILSGISGGVVSVSLDGQTVVIPYNKISKARLVIHGENECLYQT